MKTIPCWIWTHLAWHIWNSSGVNHDGPHFWETVCAGSLTKEKEIMFQVVDSVTPDNQFFSYFSLYTLSLSNNRLDVCIFTMKTHYACSSLLYLLFSLNLLYSLLRCVYEQKSWFIRSCDSQSTSHNLLRYSALICCASRRHLSPRTSQFYQTCPPRKPPQTWNYDRLPAM